LPEHEDSLTVDQDQSIMQAARCAESHVKILTWAKDRIGLGDWLRGQTEHALMAVRGSPRVVLTNQSTLLPAPMGRHSEKPEAFYSLIESLCPAPVYLELIRTQGTARLAWVG